MPTWSDLRDRMRALLCAAVLACLGSAAAAQPSDRVLELAHAVFSTGGAATEVVLPYHWDRAQRNRAGQGEFQLEFPAPQPVQGPWGLYLPRVGNRAELRLNGRLLAAFGKLDDRDGADYKKQPQYVAIPPGLLMAQNVLQVRIAADASRRGGLSPLFVGPAERVYPLYRDDNVWLLLPSLGITFLSGLVGIGALVLWATQTEPDAEGRLRRDPIYLSAAAAELFWTLRVGDTMIERPPLPWPAWSLLVAASFAGWMCCMGLFSLNVAGWQDRPAARKFRFGLAVLFSSSVLTAWLARALPAPAIYTAWLGAANVGFAVYAMFYLVSAVRRPRTAPLLVGIAGGLNVVTGIRDWLVVRVTSGYAESTWIRYSSVLFALSLGYVVLSRFRDARIQAREAVQTLHARIAARERELQASYRQLEEMAREQARVIERAKILKDLHDGVGTHISSAIRQLQSGSADNAAVLETLRESLDQLKLSIDALGTPPGDVGALLASLRYRLEPRFAGSDLRLEWQVDPLEPVERLDAQGMRHLQYMLFEAMSNVLQHAQARTLTIQARQDGQGTLLRVIDDGCGFDAAQPQRKGLRSMRERAAAIGATLELRSEPGCTAVELRMEKKEEAR